MAENTAARHPRTSPTKRKIGEVCRALSAQMPTTTPMATSTAQLIPIVVKAAHCGIEPCEGDGGVFVSSSVVISGTHSKINLHGVRLLPNGGMGNSGERPLDHYTSRSLAPKAPERPSSATFPSWSEPSPSGSSPLRRRPGWNHV